MLDLPDSWVWDSWVADDGETFHLFFLFASRALIDPDRRHRRAGIGHAVSTDLTHWTRVADALVHTDPPGFDDRAVWTGSTVRAADGRWFLFYTGYSEEQGAKVQQVSAAVSDDLTSWARIGRPLASADPRWYQTVASDGGEPFRDPWVQRDDDGLWHMLITAAARGSAWDQRGILGHATSPDLVTWTVGPPVTPAGQGFAQLEVPEVFAIDGRHWLLFSCLSPELAPERLQEHGHGGVWAAPADGPLGPFHIDAARPITDETRYAGRAVQGRDGRWLLLAFENDGPHGFAGRILDPVPIEPLLAAAFDAEGPAEAAGEASPAP